MKNVISLHDSVAWLSKCLEDCIKRL